VAPPRPATGNGTAAWKLVYQEMREGIVSMQMRPGDPVREKEIAERYGLSRTPVREAVQRLVDERLVEVFPQSGTFVARIPYDELPEAIVIRKALETKAVELATRRATKSQQLTLASIIEQQREAAEANDRAAFHRADESFHAKIAEISGYPGIWRLVLQVKTQVDRFRRLTLSQPRRMFVVIEEHQAIYDAIVVGDPVRAVDAMSAHLDAVLPALAENASAEDQTPMASGPYGAVEVEATDSAVRLPAAEDRTGTQSRDPRTR
jgi:GntR family transcriptional regulator, rspAB operon transcriptional repressor